MSENPRELPRNRVSVNLIEPLELRFVWSVPAEQEAAAKADMIAAGEPYTADELQAAATYIRQHRRFATMPTVGDVVAVLESLRDEARARECKAPRPGVVMRPEEFLEQLRRDDEDAIRFAIDWLRNSELGRAALAEGFARPLRGEVADLFKRARREGRPLSFRMVDAYWAEAERKEGRVSYHARYNRAPNTALEVSIVMREAS